MNSSMIAKVFLIASLISACNTVQRDNHHVELKTAAEPSANDHATRAAPALQVGQTVAFVVSFSVANDAVVMLGNAKLEADGVLRSKFFFTTMTAAARTNMATNRLHAPMDVRRRTGLCSPGYIWMPAYNEFGLPREAHGIYEYAWTWQIENGDLIFRSSGNPTTYRWKMDDAASGRRKIDEVRSPLGATSQIYGFAYLIDQSDEALYDQHLSQTSFDRLLSGRILQNNSGSVAGNWDHLEAAIRPGAFRPSPGDQTVLGFTSALSDGASEYAHYSFALVMDQFDRLSKTLFVEHGGHDFNNDGCYNAADGGHRRLYYGILDPVTRKVRYAVFTEISAQDDKPIPIYAVGWVGS